MGSSHSLEDDLIQFKLTSKQMQRSAQKCEKNKQIQKEKMKQAMKSGNIEGAIYSI
jgi:charged multivesicular body protein 1